MEQLRQKGISILAFTFTLLLLALGTRAGWGNHREPVYVGYNARCSELAPHGVVWHQLKVSSVHDGSYSQGILTVTLDVERGEDRDLIAWSSNIGIDGVFVKGGPGGNFYGYRPPGSQATSDTALVAPYNPNSGAHYTPGHMLFCTTTSLTPPTPTPSLTPLATATQTPSATVPSPTATASATLTATPTGTLTATPTATPIIITPIATASPTATQPPDFVSDRIYASFLCHGCSASAGEPNDSCKDSRPVQSGMSYEFYPDDLHDWYWFQLEQPAEVEIRVSNFVPLAGQLAAYRGSNCEDATFLKNYGMSTPDKVLLLGQQPAGVYYIYVSNDGIFSSDDPYQLFIDVR